MTSIERKEAKRKVVRRERQEAGLCNCGAVPLEGRRQCAHCAEVSKTRSARERGTESPDLKSRRAAYARKWREANRTYFRDKQREWRANHPGYEGRTPEGMARKLQRRREFAKANPDKINALNQNYRARKANALGSYTVAEVRALFQGQRGKCADCQKKAKLTVDHITPLSRGGSNLIVNLQGLCLPCNVKKNARIDEAHQFNLWDRVA